MKYTFNVMETYVIDSEVLNNVTDIETARKLLDEGFGLLKDRDVLIVEIDE